MAGKRGATSDLNHDNWDREEEQEESGTFQRAAPEALQNRVIKTARRRQPDASKISTTSGVFSGFAGFNASPALSAPPIASSFSFLANLTNGKADQAKSNGSSKFGGNIETTNDKEKIAEDVKEKNVTSPDKPDEYYAKLKGLNQSVTQWIKSNVDENPFCILTPIFKDYERYLKEIDSISTTPKPATIAKAPLSFDVTPKSSITVQSSNTFQIPSYNTAMSKLESKETDKKSTLSFNIDKSKRSIETITAKTPSLDKPTISFDNITSEKPSFGFGSNNPDKATFSFNKNSTPDKSTFNFGNNSPPDKAAFSFGSNSVPVSSPPTFSFGTSKPFTIPTAAPPSSEASKPDEEENDEDTPPKVTFTPVVEENSLFNKRCKVFVKKDGNFSDRGTGTLFIKSVENSNKIQLIVRADTSLGNLLLNLILSDSIPLQRMGKNNVMMVCIPTPDAQPPPVPTLLRVKTTEEADELFETLQKFKK